MHLRTCPRHRRCPRSPVPAAALQELGKHEGEYHSQESGLHSHIPCEGGREGEEGREKSLTEVGLAQ